MQVQFAAEPPWAAIQARPKNRRRADRHGNARARRGLRLVRDGPRPKRLDRLRRNGRWSHRRFRGNFRWGLALSQRPDRETNGAPAIEQFVGGEERKILGAPGVMIALM